MKTFLFMLLIGGSAIAQKQVYNIQHYCIDEKPLKRSECDLSGVEYSFLFIDDLKKQVVLFLAGNRLEYALLNSRPDASNPGGLLLSLLYQNKPLEMRINKAKNRIEFLSTDQRIELKVGKSTKLE